MALRLGRLSAPTFETGKDPTAVVLRDDHQPALTFCVLDQLRRRNQFCDVEIKTKGNVKLQAHRVILAASSPFFMKLLAPKAADTFTEISIKESQIDVNTLEVLIDFIYTSVLRITDTTVQSLCLGARILQLERIEKACCKFMAKSLSVKNCIKRFHFGREHGYSTLVNQSQQFIATNISDIVDKEDVLLSSFSTKEMLEIFQCEGFLLPSGDTFLYLLLKWVQDKSRHDLLDLLSSTKFNGEFGLEDTRRKVIASFKSPLKETESIANKLRECFVGAYEELESQHIYENSAIMLFTAGGITANSTTTNAVDKFDFNCNEWIPSLDLPRRKSHSALISAEEKLYSIGGFDGNKRLTSVDIFHPDGETWSNGPAMPLARSDFAVAFDGKSIYCIGGYTDSKDTDSVEILNIHTHQWRKGPKLQTKRSYVQAALVGNSIYAVGGAKGNKRLNSVEKLKLGQKNGEWISVAGLNIPRSRPGVASIDGHIYAVGGYSGSEHLNSVECYSPQIDRWVMVESMSVPRNSPAVAVYRKCLYVAGGHDGTKILKSVECYNPETRSWSSMPSMNVAKCDFAMSTLLVTGLECVGTWM